MKKIAKKTAKFALATTAVAATGVGATTAAAAVATTAVAAVVGKKVVKGIAKSALKSSRSSEKKSDNAVAVNEYQPVAHSVYYYPVASVVSQAYSNAYSAEPARQFVLDISQLKVPFHSITLTNETSVNLFCYEDNFCFLITPKDSKTSLYKCFYREEFGEVCNHFVMFDKKHILYWTKNSNTNCFVLNAETGNMYKIHEFFPGVKGKLKSMKLRGQWLGLVAERYFSAYGAKDFIAIINIKNLGLTKPIYCGEIEKDYHIRYFELTMDGTLCVVEDNNAAKPIDI